jgi:hypothetical protein
VVVVFDLLYLSCGARLLCRIAWERLGHDSLQIPYFNYLHVVTAASPGTRCKWVARPWGSTNIHIHSASTENKCPSCRDFVGTSDQGHISSRAGVWFDSMYPVEKTTKPQVHRSRLDKASKVMSLGARGTLPGRGRLYDLQNAANRCRISYLTSL